MADTFLKAVINLPHLSLIPKDTDQISFVIHGTESDPVDVADAVDTSNLLKAFFDSTPTGQPHPLKRYMGPILDPSHTTVEWYDITAHLDGTPHGSPVKVTSMPISGWGATFTNLPSECAAVLTLFGAGRPDAPVLGPEADIPTPARARREGAPATHRGRTRPKQSHTGRVYVGPLSTEAITGEVDKQVLGNELIGVLLQAGMDLAQGLTALTPAKYLGVWSRKLATVYEVIGGRVDNAPDTQRRRGIDPTARFTFSV